MAAMRVVAIRIDVAHRAGLGLEALRSRSRCWPLSMLKQTQLGCLLFRAKRLLDAASTVAGDADVDTLARPGETLVIRIAITVEAFNARGHLAAGLSGLREGKRTGRKLRRRDFAAGVGKSRLRD
jgi:hypothetical protein